MEAVKSNLFCIIQLHYELVATDSSGKYKEIN